MALPVVREGGGSVVGRGSNSNSKEYPMKFLQRYISKSSLRLRSERTFHRELQALSVRVAAIREGAHPRSSILLDHQVQTDFSRLRANSALRPLPLHWHVRVHNTVQCSLAGQQELMGGARIDSS